MTPGVCIEAKALGFECKAIQDARHEIRLLQTTFKSGGGLNTNVLNVSTSLNHN